ncbi:MAG: anhydro-N-acetylmuramic acid kinase [Sphingobacteriaceae bacterium]
MNTNLGLLQNIANKSERLILGLMSGTSLDGLDLALCRISGSANQTQLTLAAFKTIAYPESFKTALRTVFAQKQVDLEKLTLLNAYIGNYHAELVLQSLKEWGVKPDEVDAIASHGQTIYHAPKHFHGQKDYPNATLQIGDGDHLAVKTGILTLSDFRQKHLAAGGEGAPLAIYGDYVLFSSPDENRILLNLGGIANFTFLPQSGDVGQILSTDVGPANTLIDAVVQAYFQQDFDRDGLIARSGQVNQALLEELMKHPFIVEQLPKSTGPELFNLSFVESAISKLKLNLKPEDIVATLSRLTAEIVAKTIRNNFNYPNTAIYSSGGGIHNHFLMDQLMALLPDIKFSSLDTLGIHPDAKEAVLFAILANETLVGEPMEFGYGPAVSLGKISFPK